MIRRGKQRPRLCRKLSQPSRVKTIRLVQIANMKHTFKTNCERYTFFCDSTFTLLCLSAGLADRLEFSAAPIEFSVNGFHSSIIVSESKFYGNL